MILAISPARPALAQGAPAPALPPAGVAIAPADAQRTIDILQDDARRAELLRTLKAIAAAAPGTSGLTTTTATATPSAAVGANGVSSSATTPAAGSTSVPATAAGAAGAPTSPNETSPATLVPLQAGGLMARILGSLDRWMDDFTVQMAEVRDAALALPNLFARSGGIASAAGERLLGQLGLALLAAFVIGLALEWALHRALRRPRLALASHADQLAASQAASVADERSHAPLTRDSATQAGTAQHADEASADTSRAGVRPPADDVALVQTHRDGVDRVEAVPVGRDNAAGATGPTGTDSPIPKSPERRADEQRQRASSRHHWHTLRHLPYALAALLLNILPIALFFVAANLTLRAMAGGDARITGAIGSFIEAYVATRITMTVVRMLVSPAGQGLRLLRISPETAAVLMTWVRLIVVLALFGMAIADIAQLLGTSAPLRMAFVKTAALLVHLCAVILIVKLRRVVRGALRAAPQAKGPLAAARNWLADAWAAIAIILVMGVWIVWAMGVQDGFPKVVHFVVVSAAVLVIARLLAILILGGLGRLFSGNGTDSDDDASPAPSRLSDRYYPWMRGLVSVVITVCTIVALLEAWGLDALSWFASGTLGRSLTSAALTIIVAVVIAILIWEASQYAVERRLALWLRQGDAVRAARLRTLLPMLRAALFMVVALVVGLTALNQIGINTTPLLAGASIIGVALGFGSQKLVQDFITGIFLLMENAMRVGDWVTVAGVSGSVEYLSIRTVRLRGGDGALYIVPFSSVSTVSNSNRGIGNAAVRISVSYDADIEMVIEELKRIGAGLREDPAFKDQILNDIEVWGVDSVDGSMVTLAGQMRCSDKGRWGVQREINRRILERFRELGIEIANPRASLLLAADPSALATATPPTTPPTTPPNAPAGPAKPV
jgi:small-conductance mechanosensitive channel